MSGNPSNSGQSDAPSGPAGVQRTQLSGSGENASENGVEISAENLHKSFGEQVVLDGVSLEIERGAIVAIVGGSGSGKTVLLKHLVGAFRPDDGRVRVANHEVEGSPLVDINTMSDFEMDSVRIHWAIVFQRNALLSGTVYYNLSLWPSQIKSMTDAQIKPLAEKALQAVGLDPAEIMEKARDELSGGMAKRLAIARALVMDPVLLFYDEPTAGLDPEMCNTIAELIGTTHRTMPGLGIARTSIVVTHDMHLLQKLSPRVMMLADGKWMFDGTFAEFIESKNPHIRPYIEQMGMLQSRPETAG